MKEMFYLFIFVSNLTSLQNECGWIFKYIYIDHERNVLFICPQSFKFTKLMDIFCIYFVLRTQSRQQHTGAWLSARVHVRLERGGADVRSLRVGARVRPAERQTGGDRWTAACVWSGWVGCRGKWRWSEYFVNYSLSPPNPSIPLSACVWSGWTGCRGKWRWSE